MVVITCGWNHLTEGVRDKQAVNATIANTDMADSLPAGVVLFANGIMTNLALGLN